MANGGARPGAGRKPGSMNKKTIEQKMVERTLREMLLPYAESVAQALIAKAQAGDVAAIKEYHERTHGKVTDHFNHTSNGETIAPLLVKFIDADK